ncbi:uncharacterized protein LOC113866359 [Abrus precatorius]|uniref:Uncharacterized protein LOC113866359 n=1 Tax=Abrus precatorius TaxID=3816 RepID=A0A8B8LLA7_ABRPR|nr:uncharacterized protein LOC113866359 [Abrus precatorius]
MAFIPQFYSNYTFPIDLTALVVPPLTDNSSVLGNPIMWAQDNSFSTPVHHNGALDCHLVDSMPSSAWLPSFSEQNGSVSEYKVGFYGAIAGFQNFSDGCHSQFADFEEDIKPPAYSNTATENWGLEGNQAPAGEEPNIKVERYSEEERKERILRYLKKRNQRNFNKTIKYACRKTLADRRVRVRGRFARNNELSEEDMARKKHENNHKEDFYGDDSIQLQLQNDDDDWLQEAMDSIENHVQHIKSILIC